MSSLGLNHLCYNGRVLTFRINSNLYYKNGKRTDEIEKCMIYNIVNLV